MDQEELLTLGWRQTNIPLCDVARNKDIENIIQSTPYLLSANWLYKTRLGKCKLFILRAVSCSVKPCVAGSAKRHVLGATLPGPSAALVAGR